MVNSMCDLHKAAFRSTDTLSTVAFHLLLPNHLPPRARIQSIIIFIHSFISARDTATSLLLARQAYNVAAVKYLFYHFRKKFDGIAAFIKVPDRLCCYVKSYRRIHLIAMNAYGRQFF